MRAGKRPRIFTDGEQKRDFVYIDDVIAANLAAAQATETGVYNVGCGGSASFNRVVKELNRVLKTDLPPEYFPNPYDFFQTWTEAELSHSRRGIGYDPKFDLARGIDAYYASGMLGM
jgi:ADP-L-glycero-D-manno-heptose 6-epimerase